MEVLDYPFDSEYILKKKRSIKKLLLERGNLIEKKIAILSGSTVGELQNILELFLLKHGIKPIFYQGSYNRFYEETVYENLELTKFNPDIIYIHTTVKNIMDFPSPFEIASVTEQKINTIIQNYIDVWDNIEKKFNCPIIQNNFEPLPYRNMGNADVYRKDGSLNFINALNEKFYENAREKNYLYVNDINYQAAWYGVERWFDDSTWYLYKYPFAINAIPLVSHNIANIIKSIFGKNKKALAIDLDNTLWGGVIGDDGIEGIELGVETAKGMAYTDIQKYLKNISKLGIALNICSKNDETIAKTGFNHSSSILKLNDFITFKANWNNKDLNIKEIAEELNIFTDSIVFLDDNPVERELVKNNLPEVAAPKLTLEHEYIKIIDQSGFFEPTTFTEDDKNRNEYFKSNQLRKSAINNVNNYEEYLKSLQMICEIQQINEENLQRVVQLINKTNQFNLTTKRYTLEDIKQFLTIDHNLSLCFKLKDKFGDNGIVSVLMASVFEETLDIKLWVMSCRVFKRDLEKAIFDEIINWCYKENISKLRGTYYPTPKNKIVENLYSELGFKIIEDNEEYKVWEYFIEENYERKNTVMEVKNYD
ncbi:HAD-IIIC family phosphatase [Lysinibacillus fusiformis]|uniref:HAD-IIIC family phosphatase n=1 Tax=Lysinibacillus fusiformis TaxID=28031 RepID=UPI0037FA5C93